MRTFVGTLRAHIVHIMAFIDRPLTNAVGEGLNRLIKIVKNRASGYRPPRLLYRHDLPDRRGPRVYPGFPTLFWGLSVFFVGDLMGKALSARSGAAWPRPRSAAVRRKPPNTRAVASPAGAGWPASVARNRTAATARAAVAGARPASKIAPR